MLKEVVQKSFYYIWLCRHPAFFFLLSEGDSRTVSAVLCSMVTFISEGCHLLTIKVKVDVATDAVVC